ncbi:MAG: MFS transporter [Bdellovibrionota bacterium]
MRESHSVRNGNYFYTGSWRRKLASCYLLPMKELSPEEATATLQHSLRDGGAHAFMLGAGESYLSAFAVALQATSAQIGLFGALPPLVGAAAHATGLWLLRLVSSRRRLVLIPAVLQALVWLFLAILSAVFGPGPLTVWLLIGCVLLYHLFGSIGAPAWNSLVGDIVPSEIRGKYFAKRSRVCGMVTFLGLLIGGSLLESFSGVSGELNGYTMIFLLAFLARLVSAYYLARHADPAHTYDPEQHFSLQSFILRMRRSNFGIFVFFVAMLHFAVWISAPYFAPYMLRDIQLSYFNYMIVLGMAVASQFLVLSRWGTLVDHFGSKRILEVCAMGVVPLSFIWIFSDSLWYLLLIQILSGICWAGFNLAALTFLLDAVTPPKRARCVAYQNIIQGVLVLLGALVGALLVGDGILLDLSTTFDVPASEYHLVFIVSSVLRLLIVIALVHRFREVRDVPVARHREILFRVTQLKPLTGIVIRPLAAVKEKRSED